MEIKWAVFNKNTKVKIYFQRVEFDCKAKKDIKEMISTEIREINTRIKAEMKIQLRLPKAFQDKSYQNSLDL